ncbi:hypothetical protein POV10_24840 [Klebsiella pneumoniae]
MRQMFLRCNKLVVHHSGKYEANEAGRSSLFCTALDAEFYVKREGEQIAFSLTCTKIDEAEEPKLRTYSLQPEKLFIDEEGETIHSLTVQDVAGTLISMLHIYPESE